MLRLIVEAESYLSTEKGDEAIGNHLRLAREFIAVENTLDEARRRGITVKWTSLGVEKLLPFPMIRKLIEQDRANDKLKTSGEGIEL